MDKFWIAIFSVLLGIGFWLIIYFIIYLIQPHKEEKQNSTPKIIMYKVIKDNLVIAVCYTHEEALLIKLQNPDSFIMVDTL